MNDLERYTSADYSAKRDLLVYSSNQTGIHLKDLMTGNEKMITAGGGGEGNVQFSQDEDLIMFISNGPFGRQAFLYEVESGEVRQATRADVPVLDPVLSPDGKKIVFCAPISAGTAKDYSADKVNELDNAVVIEDFGYKFDGAGYITPDDHMHLIVCDVDTGRCERLTTGVCDFMHPAWCPDSRTVVCLSDTFRSKAEGLGFDLLRIDTETKDAVRITEKLWLVSYPNPVRPLVTSDGRYVIAGMLDMPDKPEEEFTLEDQTYPEVYMYKVALDGSGAEKIFEGSDDCFQCVQFPYNAGCGWGFDKAQLSEDDEYVYYVSGWMGQGNIYRTPLSGGKGELVAGGKQVWHGLSRMRGGKFLAARSTADNPEEYFILDAAAGNTLTKVQQSAQKYLDEVEIEKTDDFFFETDDGEDRVHGFVLPPYNMKDGERYPVIVYVHGGPHPFYTYGFTLEHHAFAAHGYGVICCNPRGSSGYGRKHQNFEKAMDGTAYQDILQFVDETCARYQWIDPERIAMTGGSYGGYMTNYAAVHSDRFRTYISQRSMSNQMINYASSDMQGQSKAYKRYEDFIMNRIEGSNVAYAENVHRPILILHGEDDLRCPLEEAHQFFVAIKDTHPDLSVRLVVFPHTGHDQATDQHFDGRYHEEMISWLEQYL